jgi:hypothetical protein
MGAQLAFVRPLSAVGFCFFLAVFRRFPPVFRRLDGPVVRYRAGESSSLLFLSSFLFGDTPSGDLLSVKVPQQQPNTPTATAIANNHMVSVSAPFNVQHIPRVRHIAHNAHPIPVTTTAALAPKQDIRSGTDAVKANSKGNPNASSEDSNEFHKDAIVVCIHPFSAEYGNELSCSLGDVFKLVDAKIVNGWILTQSLSSGAKGWVPKDNVKILDLFNSTSSTRTETETEIETVEETQISTADSSRLSLQSSISIAASASASTSTTTTNSNSLIDYYTSASPFSEHHEHHRNANLDKVNASTPDRVSARTSVTETLPYSSIFVHSMYSLESSPHVFWYRIDLTDKSVASLTNSVILDSKKSLNSIHLARYYSDIVEFHKTLKSIANESVHMTFNLPQLPRSISWDMTNTGSSGAEDVFSNNISNIDNYFHKLFHQMNVQPTASPLYQAFMNFLTPRGNDFQHYVHLDDDQIQKIMKPAQDRVSKDIEINFETGTKSSESLPITPLPQELRILSSLSKPQMHASDGINSRFTSLRSTSSTNSISTFSRSVSTISSSTSTSSMPTIARSNKRNVKIKIIYRDDISIVKILFEELTFATLSKTLGDNIQYTNKKPNSNGNSNGNGNGLTFAYKNENEIFVLLRDDAGLRRALAYNDKKLVIKVI